MKITIIIISLAGLIAMVGAVHTPPVKVVSTPMTWQNAHLYCLNNWCSELVSIHDVTDNLYVRTQVGQLMIPDAWIGAYEKIGNAPSPGLNWYWEDEVTWSYTNWAPGRPVAGAPECGTITSAVDGVWTDRDCTLTYPFVCWGEPIYHSCDEVKCKNASAINGEYLMRLPTAISYVYCAFATVSNVDWCWSLIESWSHVNNAQFADQPYQSDTPINPHTPSLRTSQYRMYRADMLRLSSVPPNTHWTSTCQFNLAQSIDFALGMFAAFDILNYLGNGCQPTVRIENFDGFGCNNCNNHWIQETTPPVHLYENGGTQTCPNPINSNDYWGYHQTTATFTCTGNDARTTNWWIGGPCTVWAIAGKDPEYKSLDGLVFKYDGPCSYVMSTNRCNKEDDLNSNKFPLFEVIVRHGRSQSRATNVVVVKQVTVRIWKSSLKDVIEMDLLSGNKFELNGMEFTLPYDDDLFTIKKESIGNEQNYQRIHVETSFGLHVRWSNDKSGTFEMAIPHDIVTCGLLGNNDGKKEDDLQMKDGTILKDINEDNVNKMGDSWMVHTKNEQLRCSLYPTNSFQSIQECKFSLLSVNHACDQMIKTQFKKLTGRNVVKCFKDSEKNLIDESRIFDDCVTEICSCSSVLINNCVPDIAIKELKKVCVDNQVDFPDIAWTFDSK